MSKANCPIDVKASIIWTSRSSRSHLLGRPGSGLSGFRAIVGSPVRPGAVLPTAVHSNARPVGDHALLRRAVQEALSGRRPRRHVASTIASSPTTSSASATLNVGQR